jgi:hypothetical protein
MQEGPHRNNTKDENTLLVLLIGCCHATYDLSHRACYKKNPKNYINNQKHLTIISIDSNHHHQ